MFKQRVGTQRVYKVGFKKKLYKKDMLVIIKKCKFYTKKTDFIGFIIKLK